MARISLTRRLGVAAAALALALGQPAEAQEDSSAPGIVVDGTSFALNGDNVSYRFHVDEETGDLVADHFGASVAETVPEVEPDGHGWVGLPGRTRREFPDLGRGDFRVPAVQIRQSEGYTVTDFRYKSHDVVRGKPGLPGLPATFGDEDEVSTLIVHMYDNYSSIAADLSYSIFPKLDAIVRSVSVTNEGKNNITVERLASFSVDFPFAEFEMIELRGDWAREATKVRRKVDYGTQGFGSSTGYSSHLHNPFLSLVSPDTTETRGDAWGFSLVYTGSFAVDVEKGSQGYTRALLGFNPVDFSWNLGPGETLTTPECVSTFSEDGVGGMSRKFHRLYRNHLIRSKYAAETRPVLLNSWEGLYFDYNESTIYRLAQETAELGVQLFVLDDGWFGNEYPRVTDNAGLGDWQVNKDRFPDGLAPLVEQVTALKAVNATAPLRFGLWFEPEMVNPNSTLYREHPDWVLHAGAYPRTELRSQLVLNVALPEVQDFIIDALSAVLNSSAVSYVKWDNNRGMHETPGRGASHAYMLGLYRVFDTLTARFPDVLWEGCASGGGRFDPGVLQYFPQVWTSDDTDALMRVTIQFGTSLVYPASAMGAHVSVVPNHQTGRTIPFTFRAHVALMGGSFGFELDPSDLAPDERALVPGFVAMAERVGPLVVRGDMYRLRLPEDSNYPAALFVAEDGASAVLFCFQLRGVVNYPMPYLRLQGLDPKAKYTVNGTDTYSGSTLMKTGLQYKFSGDYDSKVVFLEKA